MSAIDPTRLIEDPLLKETMGFIIAVSENQGRAKTLQDLAQAIMGGAEFDNATLLEFIRIEGRASDERLADIKRAAGLED